MRSLDQARAMIGGLLGHRALSLLDVHNACSGKRAPFKPCVKCSKPTRGVPVVGSRQLYICHRCSQEEATPCRS